MSVTRPVRAIDVAHAAGVSTATVSYVLNNNTKQKISTETQERVRKAARDLGYVSNAAAQTLARGRSTFLIVDMTGFATEESAASASAPLLGALRTLGYEPYMSWWPTGTGEEYYHDQLLQFAQATRAVGVISAFPLDEQVTTRLRALGVSMTASLANDYEELLPALSSPTKIQVDYLVNKGHKEILYVATADPIVNRLVEAREAMGRKAAEGHGVSWIPLPRHKDTNDLAGIIRQARVDHPNATAIAAYNDADALASLFALGNNNVKVPDEVAVIGVGDHAFATIAHPALTTVGIDFDLSGFEAESMREALAATRAIGYPGDPSSMSIPYVVERESA